jgi:hypothetical protein
MVFQFNEALERIGSEIEKDQAEQVRNTMDEGILKTPIP